MSPRFPPLKKAHRQLLAIGTTSAFQIACLSLLSFVQARFLTPEDFGTTRIVAAYFLVAIMCSHFCLQDGVAAYLAGAATPAEGKKYAANGLYLIAAISLVVTLICEGLILSGLFWQGSLQRALAVVFLSLPASALALLFMGMLQATGAHTRINISLVLGGLVPLVVISFATLRWGLSGWGVSRLVTAVLLMVLGAVLAGRWLSCPSPDGAVMARLAGFAKFQFMSGLVSMMLQSADVIVLERMTGRMELIGCYGLGILFSNAAVFVLHTIDRVYFKEVADAWEQRRGFWGKVRRLVLLGLGVCAGLFVVMNLAGPWLIRLFFGEAYAPSIAILRISSVGLFFNGIWTVVAMVNTIIKKSSLSLAVSLAGLVSGVLLLVLWVPRYGIHGAAWAMTLAYAVGAALGLFQLWRFSQSQPEGARSVV